MTISELAIKRPTLIVVIFSVLMVLGIFSYSLLNYELLPKITPPIVTIQTIYPGASPYEVESSVSKKIEDAVSGIDQISAIRTTSFEGVSFVLVEFNQSAKIDVVLQDAQRKVSEIAATLPSTAKPPTLSKIALDETPVLRIGVTSTMPSREFYQFLKDRVQPRLSKLAGVAQIALTGGEEREIKINLDGQKLSSYGLSVLQVTQAIKNANLDFPTGKVKDSDYQFIVRVAGKISSIAQLQSLSVGRSKQGGDIRLADVAEVQDGSKEFTQMSRVDGITSVGVLALKQSDANAVEVSKILRAELLKIQEEYKQTGIVFDIAQDSSTFTVEAATAVKEDLMLAIVLVAIVMLLFLHSVRNSLIVMIAIPASLISTFIVMWALGFSLNLMTLLGMSLVIGILVDDSIVVLENIYRHLEMGEEQRVAALAGRNEIGFAALSITMVDVVVFLPLSLVSGLVGNILREFALVVVASTLMSLFVSFTITPLLASRFTRLEHMTKATLMGRFGIWFEDMFKKFTTYYESLLRWAMGHKKSVALMTTVMFIGSLSLAPLGFIGNEFMPQSDRGEFSVTIELPPGATVEQTNQASLTVEKILSSMPEIKKVFTTVGVSNDGLIGFSSNNVAQLNVELTPRTQRVKSTDLVGEEIKAKVRELPGLKVRVNPIGIFGVADQAAIQIGVSGTNLDDVQKSADRLAVILARIPGTTDVRLSSEQGKPEMRVEIDRDKMAVLGLSVADVGATLRVALTGNDDSKFRDGANEYDIRIVLDESNRSKTSDIRTLTFMNSKNQQIQLQQFATVYQTAGPTKLSRQDRINIVYLYGQTVGRPSGTIIEDFKTAVKGEQLPAGIDLAYLGMEKDRASGFQSLGMALFAGILFVYLIMVALYDSYVYPIVVLFSIPVAMVGAFLALALANKSLSIFSILGIIMLVGLVAKNAILLVDRANQMKAEGMNTYDALIEAGATRLRPILMTTVAMVVGMFPIAVSTAAGAQWKSGLAWALIGGLTSSMFLTLLVVPVVYAKVDEWRDSIPALFNKPLRFVSRFRKPAPDALGAVGTAAE
jgi:HAE1 family hydrophobic/amphiphilic exporter-1